MTVPREILLCSGEDFVPDMGDGSATVLRRKISGPIRKALLLNRVVRR